jgi:ribosome-binding protein aMBF1 (putative translation factor)
MTQGFGLSSDQANEPRVRLGSEQPDQGILDLTIDEVRLPEHIDQVIRHLRRGPVPQSDRPELLVAFGLAVRRLRTARGLSQEQLAEDVGIHRTYIGDVERGLRNLGLLNVDRIAAALGTDLAGLMTEVEAERRH